MRYTRHLFKCMVVLLLFSATVMFVQAYRTTQNENRYHTRVLIRSVEATAREIELSIRSSQRALQIFAEQERSRLARIVSSASRGIDDSEIARQIALYFPDHLAYAISDPLARTPMISELSLFGQHCQQNMEDYASSKNALPLVPVIHDSGLVDSEHFDIMARIPDRKLTGKTVGIVFLSFKIKNLERLVENGGSEMHVLALEDHQSMGDLTRTAQIEHLGKAQPIDIAADQSQSFAHSSAIAGTTWAIKGWLNPDATFRVRNASLVQTVAGFIALIIAGLTAWRSIEQEKMSRNRTSIVLESIEAERKRIARDLHDQVLSDVNHTKRLLAEVDLDDDGDYEANNAMIHRVQHSIDDFSSSIRTAIEDLHPHTLENLGLSKAIEAYAQSRCYSGPTLTLQIANDVDATLRPNQQLQLYRIAAEVIDNTLSHSQCSDLHLSLSKDSQNVTLLINDNGVGFDPKKCSKPGSHGLNNIESRSASLDARISWSQGSLGGSNFKLSVPLPRHDIS